MDVMLSSVRDDWAVLWLLFTAMRSFLQSFLCFCPLRQSSTCIPHAGDELQPSQSGRGGQHGDFRGELWSSVTLQL